MSNKINKLEEIIDSVFGTGYAQSGAAQAQLASKAAGNANATAAALAAYQAGQQRALAGLQAQPCIGVSGAPYGNWNVTGVSGSSAPYVDPLVYATQTALKQPSDKKWRRFQHVFFKPEDVDGFHSEGSGSIQLRLRGAAKGGFHHVFTLPFECDDPVQWFAEHVLSMEFPNANRST